MSGSKPSQRERLVEAMTVIAARHGYSDASIARVVKQAGVSRATFYAHFADKEDCFLAAYRSAAAAIELVGPDDAGRFPDRWLSDLLAAVRASPAVARLFLVESLAGSSSVRAEHEQTLDAAEGTMDRWLARFRPRALIEIPARALLGGVAGVVAVRVFRGEGNRLNGLSEDFLAWIESHALPPSAVAAGRVDWEEWGRGLRGATPDSLGDEALGGRLPRGRGSLSPSLVAGEQRKRMLAAVARLSREKGYAGMTVADIVTTAGVTREAFYEQFRSKEDAFLATQAFGLEQSVSLTAGSFFDEKSWPDRVWNGLEAMLSYVAGQRDLVFVDLVESYAAGSAAIRRSIDNRMAFTLFLEDGYQQRPEAKQLPRAFSEMIAAAIHELMRSQVVTGRTERMLELLPQVAFVTLTPLRRARGSAQAD